MVLLPFMALSAMGHADDASAYSYSIVSFNDGNGNLDGWECTEDGNSRKVYTRPLPAGYSGLNLCCWLFSTEGPCYPYAIAKSIDVRKGSYSEWVPVTINNKALNPIPDGFDEIRVTLHSAPKILTLGPAINPLDREISITQFDDARIITGTMTDKGIQAAGQQEQTVEIAIPCESAATLTQGWVEISDACWQPWYYYPEEGWEELKYLNESSLLVTAVTADGETVSIPVYDVLSFIGMMDVEYHGFILPLNTVEIRIRWDFKDVEYNYEANAYPPIYVRPGENNSSFITKIFQPAGENVGGISKNLRLSTDPAQWYDFDGDGIKEWVITPYRDYNSGTYHTYGGLCKFNADFAGFQSLDTTFPVTNGWVKYAPGDGIGLYEKSKSSIYHFDGTTVARIAETEYFPVLLDYNNDGLTDFWIDSNKNGFKPDKVLTADISGRLIETNLTTITPEEYYNYVMERPSSGLGSGVSFVGDSPDHSKEPGSFSTYDLIDLNNDGYLDFINGVTGRYLMNTGDGRYMDDSFGGTVLFRDFDGDGMTDMLTYDADEQSISLCLQRNDGNTETRQLFKGLKCGKEVWCRDFDRDGDVDILVPFNGKDNGSQSYLVMFENTGKGKFKKHEYYIEGGRDFHACADWNADGKYEIISIDRNPNNDGKYPVQSFAVNGMNVNTTADMIHEYRTANSNRYNILIGDVDNTGVSRLIFSDDMFVPDNTRRNSSPDRPAAPSAVYDPSTEVVTISWSHGNDKETAPLDLTYELRIGSAPGLGDIVFAYAATDGSRLNMLQGNCGYSLHRRFNTSSWPQGKIYVSVQAIDDGGLGSEFSEPVVFEKSLPAAEFSITGPEIIAVGDRLTLHVTSGITPGHNITWSLEGAEIESGNDGDTTISYPTPGNKEIALIVRDSNGNSTTRTHTIEVVPARIDIYPYDTAGLPYYELYGALDMDLDGKVELVASPYEGAGFYDGDENGNYTPVRRLFNTNVNLSLNGSLLHVADINRDGLPDLLFSGYDGSSFTAHYINEDDKSMQYQRYEGISTLPKDGQKMVDLDNDGLKDATCGRNTGDYLTFTYEENMSDYAFWAHYTDLNGDGLIDIVSVTSGGMKMYVNKGNFQFELSETVDNEDLRGNGHIGDFDGDGKTDYAWDLSGSGYGQSWDSDFLFVRWSDGEVTKIPAPDGTRFHGIAQVFDYDNNGCQDLLAYTADGNYEAMILFNTDRSFKVMKSDGRIEDIAYTRTDGRTGIGHSILTCKRNQAPTAPSGLRVAQNSNAVVIEWNRASDAETPAAALRYNISVKKAGAEGEGSYHISPLNGGLDGVPVPSNQTLLTSTKLTIPLASIAEGEYEVKIQAVDTQWKQGDFSETVSFTVVANSAVDMPTATMVGEPVRVNVNAGFSADDINFGSDAEIESVAGNVVTVHWNSEGLKNVTTGKFTSQIYVNPRLDASFFIPDVVYKGDKIRVTADVSHPDQWEATTGTLEQHIHFSPIGDIPAIDFKVIDDNTVEFVFSSFNTWTLRHTITESYGSDEYRAPRTTVSKHPEAPAISLVDIDPATGKHRLVWNVPAHLEGVATHVNIYKETAQNGVHRIVATLPVDCTDYVDPESNPLIVAGRYALNFITSYGETVISDIHRPIHLMINKGIGNSWNLAWGKYEGRDINTYRILRGDSPSTLDYIAEVSGGISSYTDVNAPAGECYYAIEILTELHSVNAPDRTMSHAINGGASRSNVVSTADAGTVVLANSIEITSETGSFHIDASQQMSLQLLARILPVNVSLHKIDWVVKSGYDVASVNESGAVTAIGAGSAVIAAYATDGSGACAEVTVTVDKTTEINNVAEEADSLRIRQIGSEVEITGIRADETNPATLYLYNMNGVLIYKSTASATSHRLDTEKLSTGAYIVSAISRNSRQYARFAIH